MSALAQYGPGGAVAAAFAVSSWKKEAPVNSRMPVWKSQDKIRIHWLASLCAVDALYGLTMFGKAEAPSQVVLRNVAPIPVWGALLFGAATLIWWGWSVAGGVLGAAGFAFQAAAALVSIGTGTAPSYGGPILLGGMCWWHVLIVYEVGSGLDVDRERRQQRR